MASIKPNSTAIAQICSNPDQIWPKSAQSSAEMRRGDCADSRQNRCQEWPFLAQKAVPGMDSNGGGRDPNKRRQGSARSAPELPSRAAAASERHARGTASGTRAERFDQRNGHRHAHGKSRRVPGGRSKSAHNMHQRRRMSVRATRSDVVSTSARRAHEGNAQPSIEARVPPTRNVPTRQSDDDRPDCSSSSAKTHTCIMT